MVLSVVIFVVAVAVVVVVVVVMALALFVAEFAAFPPFLSFFFCPNEIRCVW